jgi:hypothetical protein
VGGWVCDGFGDKGDYPLRLPDHTEKGSLGIIQTGSDLVEHVRAPLETLQALFGKTPVHKPLLIQVIIGWDEMAWFLNERKGMRMLDLIEHERREGMINIITKLLDMRTVMPIPSQCA